MSGQDRHPGAAAPSARGGGRPSRGEGRGARAPRVLELCGRDGAAAFVRVGHACRPDAANPPAHRRVDQVSRSPPARAAELSRAVAGRPAGRRAIVMRTDDACRKILRAIRENLARGESSPPADLLSGGSSPAGPLSVVSSPPDPLSLRAGSSPPDPLSLRAGSSPPDPLSAMRRGGTTGESRSPSPEGRGGQGVRTQGSQGVRTRFTEELAAAGAQCTVVCGEAEAGRALARTLAGAQARRVVGSDAPLVQRLLHALGDGFVLEPLDRLSRDELFACDAGVTTAQWGIAETGTLVLESAREKSRLLSLVPPTHVVLLSAGCI